MARLVSVDIMHRTVLVSFSEGEFSQMFGDANRDDYEKPLHVPTNAHLADLCARTRATLARLEDVIDALKEKK